MHARFNGTSVFDFDANDIVFTAATTLGGAFVFGDDTAVSLGTGAPADLLWETADANANKLLIQLPAGGSVDVPVLVIGDTIENDDMGLHDGVVSTLVSIMGSTATATGPSLEFRKSRGTNSAPTVVTSADDMGSIDFYGAVATNEFVRGARILAEMTGTIATTRGPGVLTFQTATDACPSVLTTAMTLTAAQLVSLPNGTGGLVVGNSSKMTVNGLVPDLQLQGTTVGVDGAALVALYSSTAADGPEIILGRSKSATLGTNTIVATNDSLGRIVFMGADGGTGFDPAASIEAFVDATPGASTDMPGRLVFATSPDGSQTPAERVRISTGATTVASLRIGVPGTSTGTLTLAGVTGTTAITITAPACGTGAYTLPTADAACSGMQLTCNASGVTSWAAASLGAFKNDLGIVCGNEALTKVISSPVHHFTYAPEKMPTGLWNGDGEEFVGVFGEEALWAMQGARKRGLSLINSVGHLTAALQALNAKVEALEAKV